MKRSHAPFFLWVPLTALSSSAFGASLHESDGGDSERTPAVLYDDLYAPPHLRLPVAVDALAGTDRDFAIRAVYSALNSVPDPRFEGARTLPPPEEVKYDMQRAEEVLDELLALGRDLEEALDQLKGDVFCPTDRPRPVGESARTALSVYPQYKDAVVVGAYRRFLTSFDDPQIVQRIEQHLLDGALIHRTEPAPIPSDYDASTHLQVICEKREQRAGGEE
jgi:hypothetical protein